MANILIYALHYEGAINKNSLGAVSEAAKLAAELGGEAHAILLGENVPESLAASLGNYGAKKVLVAEGPEGLAQPLVDAMAKAITDGGYSYALFGGGLLGFEIGAFWSLLIATMFSEDCMPTLCWIAPEMPSARYSFGATVLPVWPICAA